MVDKVLFDANLSDAPDVSIIFLDWSCRESFHSLDYLSSQSVSRDRYEIIWIEYYGRVSPEIKEGLERASASGRNLLLDRWIVLGFPDNVYYHKHLMYNVGIAVSRGRIICICDSDAIFAPTFVETIIDSFNRDRNIVLHMDEVRNVERRFYPFNHPTVEEILREGCINWKDGKTTGVLDREDPLHTRNYGACMCALRDDIIAIGGADEHIDYLGHVCGPYELTFRLVNYGKRDIWHEEEYLYHVWHPGTDGRGNYMGPHDGRNMSSTALEAIESGRVEPLEENPAIRLLRLGRAGDKTAGELVSLAVREEKIEQWTIDENEYNLALGKEAYNSGDFDGAIRYWQKVLEKLPPDGEILANLGWALYMKSDYDEALKAFEKAAGIDGGNLKALSGKGWIGFQRGRFDEAADNFSRVLENVPPKGKSLREETLRGRGWALFHLGRLGEAEQDFRDAIEITEGGNRGALQDLYRGLGWVCIRNGDFRRAKENFKLAIKYIDPCNEAALADARRGFKMASGASVEAACSAEETGPGIFEPAEGQVVSGPPADSYFFEDGAGLTELKSDLWSRLGWAYYLSSNYDDALVSFENAVKLNGRNHRALNGLGWTLMQKGIQNNAVSNFNEALKYITPGDRDNIQEITRGRGWAYLHGGSWQKAIEDFDRAIENCDPSNMAVLRELNRGKSIAFLRLGRVQDALECAALAGESAGGYMALLKLRARIMYMLIKKIVRKLLG